MSTAFDLAGTGSPEAAPCGATVVIDAVLPGATLLVPAGIRTPYETMTGLIIDGGKVDCDRSFDGPPLLSG